MRDRWGSIRTKMKLSFRMSSTFYVNNLKKAKSRGDNFKQTAYVQH